MRTNIDLDDHLMDQAMKFATARSKRGVVHEALATYIGVKTQEQKLLTYKEKVGDIRRRLLDYPLRTSSHSLIRADRTRSDHARGD